MGQINNTGQPYNSNGQLQPGQNANLMQSDSAINAFSAKVPGILTRYTTSGLFSFSPDSLRQVDTSLTDVHRFDPVLDLHKHYTNLGNNGSPAVPLFFDFPRQTAFDFGMHQWDIYRLTENNIPYYSTRSPYSDFSYAQGPTQMQYFKAIHSQNITPYWNASVQYRKIFSQGFYDHEVTNNYNFGVNTWYRSRSRRYMLNASAIWNDFKYFENGGIGSDSAFEASTVANTRLIYAKQEFQDQSYNLKQYFYFGTKDERKLHDSDSVATKLFYPRFYISHSINIYNLRYSYFDTLDDTRNPIFFTHPRDSVSSHDQYRFRDISNTFSIGQVEYHGKKGEKAPVSILLNGYGKHDLILARHPGKDTSFQNAMIGGGLTFNAYIRLQGEAAYVLYGYNMGDYNIAAKLEVPFRILKKNNTLGFAARNQESRPAFLDNTMYSNHFSWENHFLKTKYLEGEAFLYSDSLQYKITARYNLVSSLVYYGYFAEPEQAKNDFHYIMLNAEKNFRFGHLHLNNSLIYQHALQGTFVRFPDLSFRASWFWETALFKNAMLAQFGIDMRYNSTYEAYAYMPGISRFYLQDGIKIGNYPYFDVWVSGRISKFRLYAKVEHINQGLTGNTYYASPHYPFYPRTLVRLGIRWMFNN
jgi:hypothetical protein